MKFRLFVLLVSSFLVALSLSAAPKPKMKEVRLSSNVKYAGYMVKKSPSGSGAIGVYYFGDLSKMDLIAGEFDGNKISNATMQFSHEGPIFNGEMIYEVKEDCIVYTFLNGKLSGTYARGSHDAPFSILITEPTSITRTYNDFCLSTLTLTKTVTFMAREYRSDLKNLPNSQKTKLQKVYELVEGIEGCSGVAQTYDQVITLSGQSEVTGKDGYYTCNRFDLANGAYIFRKNNEFELLNSKNYLFWGSKNVVLKKVFNDGLISYSSNEDIVFVDTKSYMANFIDAFKSYCTDETIESLSRVKYTPDYEINNKPLKCLTVEYPDGRKYYGVLMARQGFTSVTDFFTKIKNTSGFPTQDLYRDGVLTYPDGRQEVFVKGNTLSQLLEYSQKKEAEEKAALAKKIEEVNLRLILENEACTIRNFLKGNVKSIELCYEEMCLTLLANYSEDGRIISTGGGADLSVSEETYHYDAQGRIDSVLSVYQYGDAKPEKTQIKFFYDEMGRLVRKESYMNKKLTEKVEYKYDNQCNPIDESGKLIPMPSSRPSSYRRQYDYRGNIISEERDEELITYKIEYWD